MHNKYLEDSQGNKSSKRLVAMILLINLLAILWVGFIKALAHPLGDSMFIKDLIYTLGSSITILLGIGVFEKRKMDDE